MARSAPDYAYNIGRHVWKTMAPPSSKAAGSKSPTASGHLALPEVHFAAWDLTQACLVQSAYRHRASSRSPPPAASPETGETGYMKAGPLSPPPPPEPPAVYPNHALGLSPRDVERSLARYQAPAIGETLRGIRTQARQSAATSRRTHDDRGPEGETVLCPPASPVPAIPR